MKISELIKKLQEIQEEHGDAEVMVNDFDINYIYYDDREYYVQIEG